MEARMRALILLAMMAGTAVADEREEAIKKTAVRLTLAYQCAAITGDYRPYEWAKENAAAILADAGVTDPTVEQFVAKVEEQSTEGSHLNEKFCRNMLKNFK
jgi:hypothetical protein